MSVEQIRCPHCDAVAVEYAKVVRNRCMHNNPPPPGHPVICWLCARISVHREPYMLRLCTKEEIDRLSEDRRVINARFDVLLAHADWPMILNMWDEPPKRRQA